MMKNLRRTVALTAVVVAATAVPAAAHAQDADRSGAPDRITLPNGWLPEGITTDGKSLFSGSRADGAILKIGIRSGGKKTFAGAQGRIAVGLDHDARRDVLWVAGGSGKQVRAQDADTGKVLRTYRFPGQDARFVNDVTVTRTAVYATDSLSRELLVIPLSTRTEALPAAWRARTLPLKGDLRLAEGNNLNGIVSQGDLVVAVQSNTGRLFTIDPRSGRTTKIVTGGKTFVNGDGLELGRRGILYVVQNRDNRVRVLKLSDGGRRAKVVDTIGRSDFPTGIDVPSTVALVKDSLFAVNARFGVANPETADYWIARADAYR
jgi:outer membrane protein assembly factor BamB